MSFTYGQVLRSGLIVMAADRAVRRTLPFSGPGMRGSIFAHGDIQKLFVTKNNIGITSGGTSKDMTLVPTLAERVFEAIRNIDIEKYRTPLDIARYLVEFTKYHDSTARYVFTVGGHDLTGSKPKPVLYEADTLKPSEAASKMTGADRDGICLVNNGRRVADIAINTLHPKINSEIIFPNAGKIGNCNKQGAMDFALFAAGETRKFLRLHDGQVIYDKVLDINSVSREIDILAIYHDRHEWQRRDADAV